MDDPHRPPGPPGLWLPAQQVVETFVRPLERFLHVEAASGVLLLGAALVALVWANSPFRHAYALVWQTPVTLGFGSFVFVRSVHFWINDGLMVFFFFVVGLEIRCELHHGELSDARRAALPVVAALGGMLAPAAIYFAFNHASPGRDGWGVPMATDIAFAVGVLALLGKRVPAALRVFLLALAIIDDIGAIFVIAIFYSRSFAWSGLGLAALGILGVRALLRIGVRRPLAYAIPGVVVWAGCLRAGVHPAIAGIIVGLLTPARPWYGEEGFLAAAETAIEQFRSRTEGEHDEHDLLEPLSRVAEARREAVPPVIRLESALHPWVAYGIMPLFALANAGVDLGSVHLGDAASIGVTVGIASALVLGKPLGVLAFSFAAVRLGIASRPSGLTWRGLALVGVLAGVGFTMAIFIAGLAFREPGGLAEAKLGVLVASGVAGILGLALGRVLLPLAPEIQAVTADGAEKEMESGSAEQDAAVKPTREGRSLRRAAGALPDRIAATFDVLPADRRATVTAMMERSPKGSAGYWLQLMLAMGIAWLGLVLGSAAVVIGAMLISPLMDPIVELGMGLTIGSPFLVMRSFIRTAGSIAVIVVGAALLTLLLPYHEVTAEIATRTSPTLLDLSVAIFCAIAAAYSAARPGSDTTATAAGTAVAIALVPPLCVVGYGLGTGALRIARGSALLFTANFCAILLFAVLFFLLLGYSAVGTVELEQAELARRRSSPRARAFSRWSSSASKRWRIWSRVSSGSSGSAGAPCSTSTPSMRAASWVSVANNTLRSPLGLVLG